MSPGYSGIYTDHLPDPVHRYSGAKTEYLHMDNIQRCMHAFFSQRDGALLCESNPSYGGGHPIYLWLIDQRITRRQYTIGRIGIMDEDLWAGHCHF